MRGYAAWAAAAMAIHAACSLQPADIGVYVGPTGETENETDGSDTGAPDTDGSSCLEGAEQACYGGPAGTLGVGACAMGRSTCGPDGVWGPCEGQVIPSPEICANQIDEDCDGEADESEDLDGDGWARCEGDCCDEASLDCPEPSLANPGAFEVGGNGVDDDCDGGVDEAVEPCDLDLASGSGTPLDYAHAIELCQETAEDPEDPTQRTWGVISAELLQPDGQGQPSPAMGAARPDFGANLPFSGDRLLVMSTGHASDLDDELPGFFDFQPGRDYEMSSDAPADWLAANDGAFPNAPGCPSADPPIAYDGSMLQLRVRVPTNARSFSLAVSLFSAEFPEAVCTQYHDSFVALLDTQNRANPADRNIAVFIQGENRWPLGLNLIQNAPGMFTVCEGGEIGCLEGMGFEYDGCLGSEALIGTGYDELDEQYGGCGNHPWDGGATGWLRMVGDVEPGEVMTLRLAIWDTTNGGWDSTVIVDDFRWNTQSAPSGLAPIE